MSPDKERRRYEGFEENRFDEEKRELQKEFIKHITRSRDKAFARCEFWSAKKFEAEMWKFAVWRRKQFEEDRFQAEYYEIMKGLILHLQKNGMLALCDDWTPEEFEVELRKFSPFYFARKEEALAEKRKKGVKPPVLDCVDSTLQCVRDAPVESYDDPNACEAGGRDAGVVCSLQCVCDAPAEVLQCVRDAPAEASHLVTCEAGGRHVDVDCVLQCVCDALAVEVPDLAACEAAGGHKDVACVLQCVRDASAKESRLTVSCKPFARSVCVEEESVAFGWNALWCAQVEAALPPGQPPPVERGAQYANHTMIRATMWKKERGSVLLSGPSLMVSLGWRASCVLPARLIV